MKFFQSFRLDTANQCLWREENRVPIAPKSYDILRYLVENPGRLIAQDELLEKLWPDTYVNPEVIRKYILEIRKILGDRLDKPEFIETVPKRGYRFIASVTEEIAAEQIDLPVSNQTAGYVTEPVSPKGARSEERRHSGNHRLWKLAAIPVLTVFVVAGVVAHFGRALSRSSVHPGTNPSIAVLPFVDMSEAKDQEYFSDGLSEQLIHDLAKVSGLKVVGRSSSFQFRDRNEDLRDVGRKLGVATILEGSVRRDGDHLRITAELVKVEDGFELWSQTYDRNTNDVFAVQDDIARAATEALQVKLLGGNGRSVVSSARSTNAQAYQAYLEANYFFGQGHSKDNLSKALDYADQAIKLDAGYAPAWALRAMVNTRMAGFSLIDLTEGSRKARSDAERAIVLDPSSASGYLALATTQNDYDWDWDAANASLQTAAALEPGNPEVFRHRSYLYRELGDLDQAIPLYAQAIALDPLRADFRLGYGYLLYEAARYDEAQAELQKALGLNPQAALVHATLSKILIAEGNPQQALAEIDKEPNEWGKLTGQVLVYHALGREKDSNLALAKLIAAYGADSAFQIAEGYAFRGETNKSFEWLERAYKQRDGGLTDMKIDPVLENLHGDPRFVELLNKMHRPIS
jgi:TolB-like protein/DNA-binding winged helix-turn-helix (wHTH) protein/tetratricopeptide (TPR) repeat protein